MTKAYGWYRTITSQYLTGSSAREQLKNHTLERLHVVTESLFSYIFCLESPKVSFLPIKKLVSLSKLQNKILRFLIPSPIELFLVLSLFGAQKGVGEY